MNNFFIRDVRPEDVFQTQEVFYRTWLATYPNAEFGVTVDDIEDKFKGRNSEERIAKIRHRLASLPETERYLVAEVEGSVVGLCRMVIDSEKNNLQAIYVLPEHQGKGIGKAFWEKSREFFDADKPIVVNVATFNSSAIAFYKSLGFKETGKTFTEERHKFKSGSVIPEMELVISRGA